MVWWDYRHECRDQVRVRSRCTIISVTFTISRENVWVRHSPSVCYYVHIWKREGVDGLGGVGVLPSPLWANRFEMTCSSLLSWMFAELSGKERLPLKRVQLEVNINKQQKTESRALLNTGMTDKSLIAVSPWPPPMYPLPKTLSFCCCPEELRHHWSDITAVSEMSGPTKMTTLRSYFCGVWLIVYLCYRIMCHHHHHLAPRCETNFPFVGFEKVKWFLTLPVQESPNFFLKNFLFCIKIHTLEHPCSCCLHYTLPSSGRLVYCIYC